MKTNREFLAHAKRRLGALFTESGAPVGEYEWKCLGDGERFWTRRVVRLTVLTAEGKVLWVGEISDEDGGEPAPSRGTLRVWAREFCGMEEADVMFCVPPPPAPEPRTLDVEAVLNVLSSAAEEIAVSDAGAIADAFCVAPYSEDGAGDLVEARKLRARMGALSEALLEIQEEWLDVLHIAAERAEERTGLRITVDPTLHDNLEGVQALGAETHPVLSADGALLARAGTCPTGWVVVAVVDVDGASDRPVEGGGAFSGKTWSSLSDLERAVREKLDR